MSKCSHCHEEIPTFAFAYTCLICEKEFCDDHCCNPSYLQPLKEVSDEIRRVVDEGGYMCIDCFKRIKGKPKDWERSYFNRQCAFSNCDCILSDSSVTKTSCKVCGLWFCKHHTLSPAEFPAAWLKANVHYHDAVAICCKCGKGQRDSIPVKDTSVIYDGPAAVGREIIDRAEQAIERSLDRAERKADGLVQKIEEKAVDSSIVWTIRLILVVVCLYALGHALPEAETMLKGQGRSLGLVLWSVLSIATYCVLLAYQVIWPAFRRKATRKYAIVMVIAAIVFCIDFYLRAMRPA